MQGSLPLLSALSSKPPTSEYLLHNQCQWGGQTLQWQPFHCHGLSKAGPGGQTSHRTWCSVLAVQLLQLHDNGIGRPVGRRGCRTRTSLLLEILALRSALHPPRLLSRAFWTLLQLNSVASKTQLSTHLVSLLSSIFFHVKGGNSWSIIPSSDEGSYTC